MPQRYDVVRVKDEKVVVSGITLDAAKTRCRKHNAATKDATRWVKWQPTRSRKGVTP